MALKKIQVCKDDLQVAHNRIDAGTDLLENIFEKLEGISDILIDCGLINVVEDTRTSLEEIEYGRKIIESMLNGGK